MEILSIDVTRELETLCEAQLRGAWQVPAELVRVALRFGADRVSVRGKGRGFVVAWAGSTFDDADLANLRTAVDPQHPPRDRQRAIAALERAGLEELLWASALRRARLSITLWDDSRRTRLEVRSRGRSRLSNNGAIDRTSGVEIEWRCAGLERRRALKWLALALRFSKAEVVVDGRPLSRGFSGGLYHLRLEQPMPCWIGLTRVGEEPALWLLRDGVVSTRASVAGYPPFEAAVELRALVAPGASGADLRRAVAPFVPELVDRAVWMMAEVSNRLTEMAPSDRERILVLLLRAAQRGLRMREIRRIPLVPNAAGHRLAVDEIEALAANRNRLLAALDPEDARRESLVDPRATLVASSEVRGLLSELAGVRFQAPSRRVRGMWRRTVDGLRTAVDGSRRGVRGLIARREVSPDKLEPLEAGLLAAVRTAMAPLAVTLCEGRLRVGRRPDSVILHRADPIVGIAANLLANDPAWLYPALVALDTGTEPPHDLRRRWFAAFGVDSELI